MDRAAGGFGERGRGVGEVGAEAEAGGVEAPVDGDQGVVGGEDAAGVAGGAGEVGDDLALAGGEEVADVGEPVAAVGGVAGGPVDPGGGEGAGVVGIGDVGAHRGVLEGGEVAELAAAALADQIGEFAVEVGEEGERALLAPFLAHEEEGMWGESRRIEVRALRSGTWERAIRRSPKARLPIWSWFCRKSTKAVGGRWADGRPRVSPVRRDGSPWKANPSASARA